MSEELYLKEIPKFATPEEELNFLRRKVFEREQQLESMETQAHPDTAVVEVLQSYKKVSPEEVLTESQILDETQGEQIILALAPEAHDVQMEEFLGVLLDKGIKNAMTLLDRMNSPHLSDDFHRFLIQYIKSVGQIPSLKDKDPVFKPLHMTLFEITLPEIGKEGKGFKEMISQMERFYYGMQSIADERDNSGKDYFTLEIAIENHRDEVIFYISVPSVKANLFEKQLQGAYPQAKIMEVTNDYNIFNSTGASAGGYLSLGKEEVFPIKFYEDFEQDPMGTILSVFTKLKTQGEGAAIQIIFRPAGEKFIKRFGAMLEQVKKGVKLKDVFDEFGTLQRRFLSITKELITNMPKKDDSGKIENKVEEKTVEFIKKKMESTIVATNIRLVASAQSQDRAEDIISDLESAFNQFERVGSNHLELERLTGNKLQNMFYDFSYRIFNEEFLMPLNLKELSAVAHFPVGVVGSPQLKMAKSGTAPAPLEMGQDGVVLGVNDYRGKNTEIYFSPNDRVRHFYVIGQTGTGKTTILKNMIIQDIRNGEGVCFMDPHGNDIQDILSLIPKERINDVIYFNPADIARPMGLNMLEYDRGNSMQKTFVVNELFSIFQKLYGANPESMGPMFEQYFRNATMLVIEDPETGNTLLDVSRVLADDNYRKLKLSRCKNPIVAQFWQEIASKAGGESKLENIVPYITSKFDVFLASDMMRPIVAQEKSSFNFRQIMDEKKIFLVDLAKGRLGEINANLLGLILVGKILMAALSRVDMAGQKLNDFYLYIDEFQNITTNSIAQILSEARKYRLSLNIAHQFIAQLTDTIKDAVFGNVGSMAVFRVSADDAKYLESQFAPVFTAEDIMKIDNYNAVLKLLLNGQPVKPFNVRIPAPETGNREMAEKIKELSALKFGRPRAEIEAEIMTKYQK